MTPDPTRRSLLATIGATVGGALAGCIDVPVGPTESGGREGSSGEVIFSSPMDSLAEIDRFPPNGISNSDNISVASDPAGTGRDVVSVSVPEDEFRGASLAYAPNEVRDGSRPGENDPDSAYVRYYVYFPADTQMTDSSGSSQGTKMGGLAGYYTDAANGGTPADGHSWSARLQTEGEGDGLFSLYYYVYHMDDDSGFGDIEFFDGEYEFGRWHEITLYASMNTPGENNGILRAWMNGNQVYEREDWRFRSENHPHAGITRAYGAYIYWGGDWGSPQDQSVYFKDLTFTHGNPFAGGDGSGNRNETGNETEGGGPA